MTTSQTHTRAASADSAETETARRPPARIAVRNADIGEAHGQPWVYVVLTGGLVLLVGPFLWMLLGSFRPDRELKAVPPSWLPQDPTLDNYRQLFDQLDFAARLLQQRGRRAHDHFGQPGVLLDAGLCLREAELPRQASDVQRWSWPP